MNYIYDIGLYKKMWDVFLKKKKKHFKIQSFIYSFRLRYKKFLLCSIKNSSKNYLIIYATFLYPVVHIIYSQAKLLSWGSSF